jgi:hypothetical protein
MKKLSVSSFVLAASMLVLSACSNRTNVSPFPTISSETKADLAAPVNCQTAHRDIKTLEDEKASVGKQILAGVRSIMPIAAVAGILMGDYRDRVQVATGQYDSDIEAKIKQIKTSCNIQ